MAHLHFPQLKSHPFLVKTSRGLRAPASIALRAAFSLMLLQMQIIINTGLPHVRMIVKRIASDLQLQF